MKKGRESLRLKNILPIAIDICKWESCIWTARTLDWTKDICNDSRPRSPPTPTLSLFSFTQWILQLADAETKNHPDVDEMNCVSPRYITETVDWALKTKYLPTYLPLSLSLYHPSLSLYPPTPPPLPPSPLSLSLPSSISRQATVSGL